MEMRVRRSVVAALAVAALVWPAGAHGQGGRNPIMFIHGWNDNSENWTNFVRRFQLDGWDRLYTLDYDSSRSNRATAQQIRRGVAQIRAANGGAKVDLITHSMGALNSRWYLKYLGGTGAVESWVSLGGANHGTSWAYACLPLSYDSCSEMVPGSSFLRQLNAGDPTPGSVRYRTWWSPCDEIMDPPQTVILAGAQNTRTACLDHVALSQNPVVYRMVRDFVR